MSHGLQVWAANGDTRLFVSSWVFKEAGNYSIYLTPGQSQTISVPGFNPATWGVIVSSNGWAIGSVSFSSGSITLTSSGSALESATYSVKILAG